MKPVVPVTGDPGFMGSPLTARRLATGERVRSLDDVGTGARSRPVGDFRSIASPS